MRRIVQVWGIVGTLAVAAACASEDKSNDMNMMPPDNRTSYGEHVQPLLMQKCSGCHNADGLAPFSVDVYDDVRAWGGAIKQATSTRRMPPYAVKNDGSCNTFKNARWLSDEDIELIGKWVDEGMAQGLTPSELPERPARTVLAGDDIRQVQTPPFTLRPAQGGGDMYQCFRIEPGVDRVRHLLGFDAAPSNPAVVHHVIGYLVDPHEIVKRDANGNPLTNGDLMAQLDAETPDSPGWSCFGGGGADIHIKGAPITWAPGGGAINFPQGIGVPVDPSYVFVVQLHYIPTGVPEDDQTTISLSWADNVEKSAVLDIWDGFLFTTLLPEPAVLQPGQADATFEWSMQIRQVSSLVATGPVEVLGVLPHMHRRGRAMKIEFEVNGQTLCGADVDRYDYDWPDVYFFETPLEMSINDTVKVVCSWDTSRDTEPVNAGFASHQEMCLLGLYVAEKK
jgi:hypothetical protein